MGSVPLSCTVWNVSKFYIGLAAKLIQMVSGTNRRHYIRLRPPCSRRQTLLSVRNRKRLQFEIRDSIDYAVLDQIFVAEDYDVGRLTRSMDLVQHYRQIVEANRTPLIVDCGANIGLASAYFSEMFPEAKVVAIEPEGGNFELARRNCQARNIDFIQAAVASEDKFGVLIDPGLGNWGYRVQPSTNEEDGIKLISLNSILSESKYSNLEPFIIKIDIEGFEEELFSKNTEWVDKFYLLIIELHDWMLPGKASSGNFLSTIGNKDRDFIYFGENVFSISNRPVKKIESSGRT